MSEATIRPPDCPDYDCETWDECEECLELCRHARERMRKTDWAKMAQALERQLLELDSSSEMREFLAFTAEAAKRYDEHRVGISYEPRPKPASDDGGED